MRATIPLTTAALCVTLLAPAVALAAQVSAQVKSYIKAVNLLDPAQFDPDSKSCQAALAAIVTCGTIGGEDPSSGAKADANYRLWSEIKADVECSANKITKWSFQPLAHDTGKEFVFLQTSGEISPALSASPSLSGMATVDKVTFKYRMRGQPHAEGNKAMSTAKPRTCTYIWHAVEGSLTCSNGQPQLTASIRASGFPSHRLWVNGKRAQEIPQGPFKALWACDATDPTMVK